MAISSSAVRRWCGSNAWSRCSRRDACASSCCAAVSALIAPALHVAADMRLSTKWGFSPHKFNLALQALVVELEQQPRVVVSEDRLELAA